MANKTLPTQAELLEKLSYDQATGELRWRVAARAGIRPGDIAGCRSTRVDRVGVTRVVVGIGGSLVFAHRVIWCMMTGEWPTRQIDHIDGDSSNNRWDNLREATGSQNQFNQAAHRNNTSGFKGVSKQWGTRKWRADIQSNGVRRQLGSFNTPEEAHAAYVAAAKELHREYAKF